MENISLAAVILGALLLVLPQSIVTGKNANGSVGRLRVPALCALVMLGLMSLGSIYYHTTQPGGLYDFDTQYWYVAGKTWLSGGSPYDPQLFHRVWSEELGSNTLPNYGVAFVYPPTLLLIGVPTALLPWGLACLAVRLLSVISLVGIVVLSAGMADITSGKPWKRPETLICVALCFLLHSVSQTIYQGQTSLIVGFGMLLTFFALTERDKALLTIPGLLFASMKPQVSLLLIVYVLVAKGNRRALWGVVVTALVSIAFLVSAPTHGLLADMHSSIVIHMQEQGWNRLNRYDSVPSLLGATSHGTETLLAGIIIGLIASVLLGLRNRAVSRQNDGEDDTAQLHLLLALTVALMPLHRYDTVLYIPLVMHLAQVRSRNRRLLVIAAVFLHSHVWDKRILALLSLPQHHFHLGSATHFVNGNYWTYASQWAAILSGVILVLATAFLFAERRGLPERPARAGAIGRGSAPLHGLRRY